MSMTSGIENDHSARVQDIYTSKDIDVARETYRLAALDVTALLVAAIMTLVPLAMGARTTMMLAQIG